MGEWILMLNQLQMTMDGQIKDKVEIAVQRLRSFEPPDGYYVAFSGGKDSQCVYHLYKMAGVKFDAHYAVTSVDPPELVRFIKTNYPDVAFERQHYPDGKPITMWSLIAEHTLPPTRKVRYCCASLKEPGGAGRIVVTGVRWAESANRASTHGVVGFQGKPKNTRKIADETGAEYKLNKHGEVILNDDNDTNRRMVEQCYRTRKTMVNPIVDWTDEDVWEFLNENNIPHCCLYDEGFKRLGCIGCPLSGQKNMIRDFERWPKYKELYIRAFQKMIDNHPGQIKILDPNADTKFKLEDEIGGGWTGFGIGSNGPMDSQPPADIGTEFIGGGRENGTLRQSTNGGQPSNDAGGVRTWRSNATDMAQSRPLLNGCSMTGAETAETGQRTSRPGSGVVVFTHWVELGAT